MVSSLRILRDKVLLVSCLVIRLHVVRLDGRRGRPIQKLVMNNYLLFKSRYLSLHHSTVIVALISTGCVWHLVMRVHLRTIKRLLISCCRVLRLRLLLSQHEVLDGTVRMGFHHVGVLLMLHIRFTLSLRYARSLRAISLFLRLLSVSCVLWA